MAIDVESVVNYANSQDLENVVDSPHMDLSVFFQPVPEFEPLSTLQPETRLGDQIHAYRQEFPDWNDFDVLIFSAGLEENLTLPVLFRQHLYSLSALSGNPRIADLGHVHHRDLTDDLLEQLSYILSTLRQHNKICLLLFDDPVLTLAQAYAFEGSGVPLECVHIGSQLHMLDSELLLDTRSYHHALLNEVPEWLFEFTQLGYQRYFVSEDQLGWLKERHFSAVRYGQLMGRIELAEPSLRTAHAVSADLSAVRASDSPGARVISPGGFSAEEFCRLARYAGLAYQINSFAITGWDPEDDFREQSTRLAAMSAWYFLEGCYSRFDDFPLPDRSNLTRYSVQLHAGISRIDFYRHPRTERWWMEVPFQDAIGENHPKTRLVACGPEDYEFAKNDDIPEKWWRTFHKLPGDE